MPSATDAGAANGLEAKWAQYYADNAPPEPVMQQAPEEEPSAGTNSLTSASTPDKSGSSAQATESPLQSPAPAAENPSSPDQPADPAQPTSRTLRWILQRRQKLRRPLLTTHQGSWPKDLSMTPVRRTTTRTT